MKAMFNRFGVFAVLVVFSTLSPKSSGQVPVVCPNDLYISASQLGGVLGDDDVDVQGGMPVQFSCVTACDQSVTISISCRTQSGTELRPQDSGSSMTLDEPPQDLASCSCTATVSTNNVLFFTYDFPFTVQREFHVIFALSLSLQSSVEASDGVVGVKEGHEGLTLICMITGSSNAIVNDIQWLKDGFPLNTDYYMLNFLAPLRQEDSGNFTCMYYNGNALLSDSMTLSVTVVDDDTDNIAVIAGSVVGSVVGFVLIVVIITVLVHRCKRYDDDDDDYIEKQMEKNGRY